MRTRFRVERTESEIEREREEEEEAGSECRERVVQAAKVS